MESAREAIKVDVVTSYKAAERLEFLLESELEELVSTSWSTVGPKVKSVTGTPKEGKGVKDRKNQDDSKEKGGKDGKGKDKGNSEPCYFCSETEDGCNRCQQCPTNRPSDVYKDRRHACTCFFFVVPVEVIYFTSLTWLISLLFVY